MSNNWHRDSSSNKIWWKDTPDDIGLLLFSFDKHIVFNMFADYPHNLTKEQKEIFDEDNPTWKEFFQDRQ